MLSMDVAGRGNVKYAAICCIFVYLYEVFVIPAKVAVVADGLKTRFGVVLICLKVRAARSTDF